MTLAPMAARLAPAAAGGAADAQALSARVAAGDDAAFRCLYDDYAPRLRRFVLALGRGDESLADEIVQQTFLTAAGKLRAVESEAHLWNWLARVARQHLVKAWRRRSRAGTLLPLDGATEPVAEAAVERTLEAALHTAMQTLAQEERELLHLFYDERLGQQEIAQRIGATAKAVAHRLDRLRDRLRHEISEALRHEGR